MKPIKTILLTTDFSATSKSAVPSALSLARAFGAKIVVFHVIDTLPPPVIEMTAVDLDDLEKRQRERVAVEIKRFIAENIPDEIRSETLVGHGVIHVEIIRAAASVDADIICMATHGRGFISHLVLGSTAERVLRHATQPVLVVREN